MFVDEITSYGPGDYLPSPTYPEDIRSFSNKLRTVQGKDPQSAANQYLEQDLHVFVSPDWGCQTFSELRLVQLPTAGKLFDLPWEPAENAVRKNDWDYARV